MRRKRRNRSSFPSIWRDSDRCRAQFSPRFGALSYQVDAFSAKDLPSLDIYGHLITYMVASELSTIRTLVATVRAARAFSRSRDNETGAHVDRTAYYSRLIVRAIAPQYALDDEQIERVFLFSPLHDIGKIGIPDNVLLKPGRLSGSEYAVMKTHPTIGRDLVDALA